MTTTYTHLPGIPDTRQVDVLELAGVFVPVVEPRRLDERHGCKAAHRYLVGAIDGAPGDYSGCYFYQAGRCNMNGRAADPCLFHEAETSTSWDLVRSWRLLERPDGSTFVTLARYAAEIAGELGARLVGAEVRA